MSLMTAVEIIREIKLLPPNEREQVESFVSRDSEKAREARQLPGEELGKLAKQMADSSDRAEIAALRAEIVKGFYGD